MSDFYPIDDLWGIKKEERLFKGSKNSVGKNFGSWHDVCLIEVGLWLQPGRKNFEILGGESSETPTGLLFFRRVAASLGMAHMNEVEVGRSTFRFIVRRCPFHNISYGGLVQKRQLDDYNSRQT